MRVHNAGLHEYRPHIVNTTNGHSGSTHYDTHLLDKGGVKETSFTLQKESGTTGYNA